MHTIHFRSAFIHNNTMQSVSNHETRWIIKKSKKHSKIPKFKQKIERNEGFEKI